MTSSISEAARAAYEPLRMRQQEHAEQIAAERKTRAERHFARVFGAEREAVVESGDIVFTVEDSVRLVYVGNLREKRKMVGPGWAFLEKCAGCKREQGTAFIATLADLGRVLSNGTPEWECPVCNPS